MKAGHIIAAALVVAAGAAMISAPVEAPEVVEVRSDIVCDTGDHAVTWYGFDTRYTVAECRTPDGQRAVYDEQIVQLVCLDPWIATISSAGAVCEAQCVFIDLTAEQLETATFERGRVGIWVDDGDIIGYGVEEDALIWPSPECIR